MGEYGPPEHVYVENDWYDGPRAGVANINGRAHRFVSQFDEAEDEYMGTFLVWPIEEVELLLEQEQWRIFVNWNERYEAGLSGVESHPGHGGVNDRWDELNSMLKAVRSQVPESARRARAQLVPVERAERYIASGPSYQLAWKLL
jgi:hypothetical protein